MYIQFVKVKSSLPDAEAKRIMEERMPQFRAAPGLVQKYYGYEKETGEFSGIYIWDSEEAMREFQQTELARTIPVAYKAEGKPRIEFFEVISVLRD